MSYRVCGHSNVRYVMSDRYNISTTQLASPGLSSYPRESKVPLDLSMSLEAPSSNAIHGLYLRPAAFILIICGVCTPRGKGVGVHLVHLHSWRLGLVNAHDTASATFNGTFTDLPVLLTHLLPLQEAARSRAKAVRQARLMLY